MKDKKKEARKPDPTKRQARYGKLVRGWDWRTTPERLQKSERFRLSLGVTRTEMIERALDEYMAQAVKPGKRSADTLSAEER